MKIKKDKLNLIVKEETDYVINEFLGGILKHFSKEERSKRKEQHILDLINDIDKDNKLSKEKKDELADMITKDSKHSKILSKDLKYYDTQKYIAGMIKLMGTSGHTKLNVSKDDIEQLAKEREELEAKIKKQKDPDGGNGEGEKTAEISDEDKLIPLYKKTPGMKGTKEKPLSSQMMQWGYPQKAVNKILKSIRSQLKVNNIEISESHMLEVLESVMDEAVRTPGATKETSAEFDRKFQEIRDQKEKYEKIKNDPNSNPRLRKNAERQLRTLDLDTKAMVGASKDWKKRTGGKKGEKDRELASRGGKRGKGGQEVTDKEIPVKRGIIKVSAPVAQYANLYGVSDKNKRRKMAAQIRKWMHRRLRARGYSDEIINMVKEGNKFEQIVQKIIAETINDV